MRTHTWPKLLKGREKLEGGIRKLSSNIRELGKKRDANSPRKKKQTHTKNINTFMFKTHSV